jgi:hypothetical protein
MKPEYRPIFKGYRFGNPVKYTPLIINAGSVEHCLALHKNTFGEWIVAHPESGKKVTTVYGSYKGLPMQIMSSRGMTLTEARVAAAAQVNAIIEKVGALKFNTVLEKAESK